MTIKPLSARNGQLKSLTANSAKLKHKLLTTDGIVHVQNCLEKLRSQAIFLSRDVCSKNRFRAKDITRARIVDADF